MYRTFTFKAYVIDGDNAPIFKSDNFFTVESSITQILKDDMAFDVQSRRYVIMQESKDGRYKRVIETVHRSGRTICIDFTPDIPCEAIE